MHSHTAWACLSHEYVLCNTEPNLHLNEGRALNIHMIISYYQARMDILKIHSRKMNLTRGINLKKIAEQMSGSSGAEAKVSQI